ncbi:glucoamylase family protein [Candidatus Methylocalor cossyra]
MANWWRILAILAMGTAGAAETELPLGRAALPEATDPQRAETPVPGWESLSPRHPDSARLVRGAALRPGGSGPTLKFHYALPEPGDAAPDEDFGLRLRLPGIDASDYDRLVLWVKGDASEGFNPEFQVQLRWPDPAAAGRERVGTFTVGGITADWKRVELPLDYLAGVQDRHRVSAFAIVLPAREARVRRGGYFLDSLTLAKTGKPAPTAGDPVVAEKKQAWEAAAGGEVAARPLLRARLVGWPSVPLMDGKTLPRDPRRFLERVAADTWRGLDALSDRAHGLPLDRVEFRPGSTAPETTRIGDYTSVTNIGFHLLAIAAAHALQLIDREQALQRLATTLATLDRLESYQGFFYNYYNTTTLERTSDFISFVDSSWLTAGLMVIRQAFPELAAPCTRLIERGDYRFFYDPGPGLMFHGYHARQGLHSNLHYGMLYAESRLGSLIAIGKGDVPPAHWFHMARTLPAEFRWQAGQPLDRREHSGGGFHWVGGHYQWRGYRYVPSWGGSLFEALMPRLVLDELRHAPASLGYNGQIHTAIQRRYALEELHYPVWGMSPSSTPGSERYQEYGVRPLGTAGYRAGVVTPHAAALALLAEPKEATANLASLAERYPLYGEFGFYDAVNPVTGEVSYTYLCLNQAMILVALADHLAERAVQRWFEADPIAQRALPLLGIERFVDPEGQPGTVAADTRAATPAPAQPTTSVR